MPTTRRTQMAIRARRWQHTRTQKAIFSVDVRLNGQLRLSVPQQPESRKDHYIDQAINYAIYYCQLPDRYDGESAQTWCRRNNIMLKHTCSNCAREQLTKTLSVRNAEGHFTQYVSQHKDRLIVKSSDSFPLSMALQQAEILFRLAVRNRQSWTTDEEAIWLACHSVSIGQHADYQLIATLSSDNGSLQFIINDGTHQRMRPGAVLKKEA